MKDFLFDKYNIYCDKWHRLHPSFVHTHILWNVAVFCVFLLFFTAAFSLINMFRALHVEIMYSISISAQLTYILYRNHISHSFTHTSQQYEDFAIFSILASAYLFAQTIVACLIISLSNIHLFLHPASFLTIYFGLCAIFVVFEIRFFYRLFHDAHWTELLARDAYNAEYEAFVLAVRGRNEVAMQAYFSDAYGKEAKQSADELATAYVSTNGV